jgi:hypothetical protein
MKRIAVIALWFGRLPNYFPLWVRSVKANGTFDFLLVTDQQIAEELPENLKVLRYPISELQQLIREKLAINPSFSRAYKLCDYRPAFGELFADEIHGYKFWGYCDMDVMFGQLANFVTPDILDGYNKIFNRGHFSLYKNDPYINSLYRSSRTIDARSILESPECYIFDEWHGIHEIFNEFNLKQYHRECIADIRPNTARLTSSNLKNYSKQLFVWHEGSLKQYFLADGEVCSTELAYIHFQKRKITIPEPAVFNSRSVLLTARSFLPYNGEITAELIRKHDQPNYLHYFQRVTKVLLKRLPIAGRNPVIINTTLTDRPLSTSL